MDPIVVAAVLIVALATIVLVGANIGGYYLTFSRPTLTILSSSGLAENYPFQIENATPITFELQLLKPQANSNHYSVIVYLSNGTDSSAQQNGPIGERLAVIGFPSSPGNTTLPVSFTLLYTVTSTGLKAYMVSVNGETQTVNITLPYRVVGLFFELASSEGQIKPLKYAWVSLWLNIGVSA